MWYQYRSISCVHCEFLKLNQNDTNCECSSNKYVCTWRGEQFRVCLAWWLFCVCFVYYKFQMSRVNEIKPLLNNLSNIPHGSGSKCFIYCKYSLKWNEISLLMFLFQFFFSNPAVICHIHRVSLFNLLSRHCHDK